MAAVLACGEGAVLSHMSAAALWELLNETKGRLVEVSTPKRSGRTRRSGIRLHRRPALLESEITKRHGIPTTTPARTIDDLRRVVPERLHRRAIRQADVLGLQLGSKTIVDGTRSELEYLFLRLCRRYRLPAPEVNVRLGSLLADFVWQEKWLVVETDGYQFHRGRTAFEDDHGRALYFRALGYEVIRLSYRQVVDEPKLVAEVLTAALTG
jgi:very-short-patch-repair endonuclease